MKLMTRLLGMGACYLSLGVVACGDDGSTTVIRDSNDGGASGLEGLAPALSPEDCAASTSELTLSQPDGAGVWGGLALLEFEVEGAKVRNFDVQVFDPALGAWTTSYVSQDISGQREDGTYFMAVRPSYTQANKDGELRLRVRPVQDGCPHADWTESEPFSAGEPLAGTSWRGEVPSARIHGTLQLQRSALDVQAPPLPAVQLELGDASISVSFDDEGGVTETLTVALRAASIEAEEELPLDGCTISLTFSGSYDLALQQYGNISLELSERRLVSIAGTSCELPAVEQLAIANEDFDRPLSLTTQSVNIDYLPTLYVEPGEPTWRNAFSYLLDRLPLYLGYETETEIGYASGYVSPQEFSLTRD